MIASQLHSAAAIFGMTCLGLCGTASATLRTSAPALDFKGDVVALNVPNSGGIPTSATYITIWGSNYQAPSWGAPASIYPLAQGIGLSKPFGFVINTFNDYIILNNGPVLDNNPARFAAAAAYVQYDDALPPGGALATATVTTLYGLDAAPSTPGVLSLAGFDTAGPFPQLSDESIIGPRTGATYTDAVGELVAVAALPALLPGYDLSIFNGNSAGSVWVFQTTVSALELVPEPTSLALALVTMSMCLGRHRSSQA